MDEDDAEEKSLGNGIDIGNGRLIIEFDDDDDVAGGGGGGACKDAAQATTELIDWLASTIWRLSLKKRKKLSSFY